MDNDKLYQEMVKIKDDYSKLLESSIKASHKTRDLLVKAIMIIAICACITISVIVVSYFSSDYDIPNIYQEQSDENQKQEVK